MKHLRLLLLSFFVCLAPSCAKTDAVGSLLDRLDDALANEDLFRSNLVTRMEDMKALPPSFERDRCIAEGYSGWSLDSTVVYLEKNIARGRALQDRNMVAESEIRLAKAYALAGYHAEAGELLSGYSASNIPQAFKTSYFLVRHILAGERMAYSQTDAAWNQHRAERNALRDSVLALLQNGTFEWLKYKREEAENMGQDSLRLVFSNRMVAVSAEDSRDYAEACFYRAYCEPAGSDGRMEWLCRSAIADVRAGTRDYAALMDLSRLLFGKGDVERSFRYAADHCMPDAIAFGGKLRPWQIARFFPEVESAYAKAGRAHERGMQVMIIIVSALLLLLLAVLFALMLRQRALRKAQRSLEESYATLKESDNVKQAYIAQFLGQLSESIDTSRRYKNHVRKYLKMGNARYLADEIDAMPPIEKDIEGFYKVFDRTFLNLYPGFVDKFNALLLPESAITPKGDSLLTPELRVFALIKLGINDSSSIASLLHYSANTIYNYRAKTKNKARGDRDHFEDAVKAIN